MEVSYFTVIVVLSVIVSKFPTLETMDLELRIITLNCWGIPLLSQDRRERMIAIAEEFSKGDYDVVCLQEVWSDSDYNLIKAKVNKVLPYAHYFHSGVIGSGICILSRYPMEEVFFHQWPVNGYVHKLQHGDWFGGKGVGLCRLHIHGFDINIYSAHLHAEYDRNCDEYLTHRVLQAFDTAQFIRLTGRKADLVVLAGDLNTEPGDLAYRIVTSSTNLVDAYIEAGELAANYFSTNEGYTNSYTSPALIKKKFEGKRIDYVLYRADDNVHVSLSKYSHPLPVRVPGRGYSYSDHEAVAATLKLVRRDSATCSAGDEHQVDATANSYRSVLLESVQTCDDALARLTYHQRMYWFLSALLLLILLGSAGMEAPFQYTKTFHVIRLLATVVACFTFVMATLWNSIEYNAVLAGKANMEVHLRQFVLADKQR